MTSKETVSSLTSSGTQIRKVAPFGSHSFTSLSQLTTTTKFVDLQKRLPKNLPNNSSPLSNFTPSELTSLYNEHVKNLLPDPEDYTMEEGEALEMERQMRKEPLEKIVVFDFQEPFATRLYDNFILTGLPRVEVKHSTIEDAAKETDALVIHLPENKPRVGDSPFINATNQLMTNIYKGNGIQVPSDWLSQRLWQCYLYSSFDCTLPPNTVIVLPFGPNPDIPASKGYPRYIFGVSVWRPPPNNPTGTSPFVKETAIRDAMRSVLNKVTSHNLKGKKEPVRRLAVPTFFTSVVDTLYDRDAKLPASQMAAAYHEYLLAKEVPGTPEQLRRIDDPLYYILTNSFKDEQLATRGLVSKTELGTLLSYATKEAGVHPDSDRLQKAAIRMIQVLLTKRKAYQRTYSDTILDQVAIKTMEQLSAGPKSPTSGFRLWGSTPEPQQPKTCLQGLLEQVEVGNFEPWKVVDSDEFEEGTILGSGAFGTVYEAIRLSDGAVFARKEFPGHMSITPASKAEVEQTRKEVAIMSLLKNPHLMTAIGANLTAPNLFVMMPKADLDLFKLIHQTPMGWGDKQLKTFADKLMVSQHIVKGMAELHKVGIVHRDLKSMNVLMSWTGDNCWHARVTDFGTARTTASIMSVQGSPAWMAPEVQTGRFGKEVDVWSFGIILWELWASRKPDDVKDLFSTGKSYPLTGDIGIITKLCISKTPTDRPTFNALLPRLEQLQKQG